MGFRNDMATLIDQEVRASSHRVLPVFWSMHELEAEAEVAHQGLRVVGSFGPRVDDQNFKSAARIALAELIDLGKLPTAGCSTWIPGVHEQGTAEIGAGLDRASARTGHFELGEKVFRGQPLPPSVGLDVLARLA